MPVEVDTLGFLFSFYCSPFIILNGQPDFIARFRNEKSFVLTNKCNDFMQSNFNQLS